MGPSGERAYLELVAKNEELQIRENDLLREGQLQTQRIGKSNRQEVFSISPEPAIPLDRAQLTLSLIHI